MTQTAQPPLIEATTENLLHDMTLKSIEVRAAKSQAGKARNAVKERRKELEGIIDELIRRDAIKHNMELPFDDDEDDEE